MSQNASTPPALLLPASPGPPALRGPRQGAHHQPRAPVWKQLSGWKLRGMHPDRAYSALGQTQAHHPLPVPTLPGVWHRVGWLGWRGQAHKPWSLQAGPALNFRLDKWTEKRTRPSPALTLRAESERAAESCVPLDTLQGLCGSKSKVLLPKEHAGRNLEQVLQDTAQPGTMPTQLVLS